MRTDDLDFVLPPERMATTPAEPRDAARLMVCDRRSGSVRHRHVRDLPEVLRAGDLLIFNQSRVIPARFQGVRIATGGRVEGLYLSNSGGTWRVMLESGGRLVAGDRIDLNGLAELRLIEREEPVWRAEITSEWETLALLERVGQPPLPPYILKERRQRGEPLVQPGDRERYNTVFAHEPGSVAAPTASLHFTPGLLSALDAAGIGRAFVTLHVGLGTFLPVRVEHLDDHVMHEEMVHVPGETIGMMLKARAAGGRIVCVGTTSVRSVESLPVDVRDARGGETRSLKRPSPFTTNTRLFIRPGANGEAWNYQWTDALMTNFHLPRSTLLAMVAALPGVGIERLRDWYTQAIAAEYRFYSFGDAMVIL